MSRNSVLAVGSALDLVPSIPELLGHQPHDELVIVGLGRHSARPRTAFGVEIPPFDDEDVYQDVMRAVADRLTGARVGVAYLFAYGHDPDITEFGESVADALARALIDVRDMVKIAGGRCWPVMEPFPGGNPPAGLPADAWKTVPDSCRGLGTAAFSPRVALTASLEPVTGARRDAMRAATTVAEEVIDGALRIAPGLAIAEHRTASCRFLRWAAEHYATGGVLDDARAATLTVALRDPRIRDEAVALAAHPDSGPTGADGGSGDHNGGTRAYLDLWTDLARRAEPRYRAPVLSLLGFCAWRLGRTALATTAAIEAAIPEGYGFARVLPDLISDGIDGATYDIPAPDELTDLTDVD